MKYSRRALGQVVMCMAMLLASASAASAGVWRWETDHQLADDPYTYRMRVSVNGALQSTWHYQDAVYLTITECYVATLEEVELGSLNGQNDVVVGVVQREISPGIWEVVGERTPTWVP